VEKPKKHGKPWSVANYTRLMDLIEKGISPHRAAALLERTEGAIDKKITVINVIKMIKSGDPDMTIRDFNRKQKKLSAEELAVITDAIFNADCIGAGRLTYAQEAIEDAGFTWTDAHERFVFEHFVEKEESNAREK